MDLKFYACGVEKLTTRCVKCVNAQVDMQHNSHDFIVYCQFDLLNSRLFFAANLLSDQS